MESRKNRGAIGPQHLIFAPRPIVSYSGPVLHPKHCFIFIINAHVHTASVEYHRYMENHQHALDMRLPPSWLFLDCISRTFQSKSRDFKLKFNSYLLFFADVWVAIISKIKHILQLSSVQWSNEYDPDKKRHYGGWGGGSTSNFLYVACVTSKDHCQITRKKLHHSQGDYFPCSSSL